MKTLIKKLLRKNILQEAILNENKNRYGCLMVNLEVDTWSSLTKIIDKEDLYEPEGDSDYGIEKQPHVTILFGLHGSIKDKDIEIEIKKIKEPEIKIKDVSIFNQKEYEVLKFDVESSDLKKLNKKFCEFPHTTDFPDYHPHITIAYLKPKTSEKYIKKIKDLDFNFKIKNICYSKTNGDSKNYKI